MYSFSTLQPGRHIPARHQGRVKCRTTLPRLGIRDNPGTRPEYNKLVYETMDKATRGLKGKKFNDAYDKTLSDIKSKTATKGTKFNKLATGG